MEKTAEDVLQMEVAQEGELQLTCSFNQGHAQNAEFLCLDPHNTF